MASNNTQKHILIVSQYFYPESFRINDIAKELVNNGYKVTVLTGIPNYPEGKFYQGYNRHKKRKDIWNGVDVIRLPILSRGKNKFKLFINYYSFVILGKKWASRTKLKFDAVFTLGTSPLIQIEIGEKISKRLHIPHYCYVQDLWPDNLKAVGGINNKFILNHYSKVCNKALNNARTVFASSPSFVETLKERINTKVVYLPQYAEDCYKKVIRKELKEIPEDNNFKIIFTGSIGRAQGLDVLVEVAKRVDRVVFVIVGNGRYKEQFLKNIKDVKDKFIIIERKAPEEIPYYLASCDAAFISFINNEIFDKTIPAKLQSYMVCGMPILASASGETKRIIEEANCGYCSPTGDVDNLIDNIQKLRNEDLKEKGENAMKYSSKCFNKKDIIKTLCEEIEMYNK